jgi:hypothetical protein
MLRKSDKWIQSTTSIFPKVKIENTEIKRLAGALFYLSNEHHHSIVTLTNKGVPSSAFALLRPQLETYIRSLWLFNCATEKQVGAFLEEEQPPSITNMLKALEGLDTFKDGRLSTLKSDVWGLFCDFVHGGGVQAKWHMGRGALGSYYGSKQINALLHYSNSIAYLNSLAFIQLDGNPRLIEKLTTSHKRIFGN